MILLDKNILIEWRGEHNRSIKWLRYINRETKHYWVSDCQYRCDGYSQYCYSQPTYALRIKKANLKLDVEVKGATYKYGIWDKSRVISIVDDIEKLVCKHSFSELFNIPINELYQTNTNNKQLYNSRSEIFGKSLIEKGLIKEAEKLKTLGGWLYKINKDDGFSLQPFYEYLHIFFKRDSIFQLCEYETDLVSVPQSKIDSSVTYMHVNHFGGWGKRKTYVENVPNRTIGFWLFKDCLVFCFATSIETW